MPHSAGGTGEFCYFVHFFRGKQNGPSEYRPKFGNFLKEERCLFGRKTQNPASVNCIATNYYV